MNTTTSSDASFGIMQPYFLPYAGYFSLIKATNNWIVFDETQYRKQSWGNRNRILKHPEGLSWISAPTKKHSRSALYSEIEIQNEIEWKPKFLRQFEYYKMNAPHFKDVINLVEEILAPNHTHLVDINIAAMAKVCEYLDIPFHHTKLSTLDFDPTTVRHSGDWGLQICKTVNAKKYVNPCMGHHMFRGEDWVEEDIELNFLNYNDKAYDQKRADFEERLSILDVLMWNSKSEAHDIIDSYNLVGIEEAVKTNV